ncbi:MAG TPA: DHHA1 domain-containing protein [Gemmatimonadaceae bacterium]|nr:DHHA1 domain-containing protein [Gemmatimonadaceae bacterium]
MTERLYYRDATVRSFSARLIGADAEGRRVYLDRTAFYPTSGGQPHDVGVLNGARVVDVVDEEDRIVHVLETALNAPAGSELRGEIDWERRHDHMQQHTGQHLLSAVLDDMLGLRTASVHFGPEASTLDVADAAGAGSVLTNDGLSDVEARVNALVAAALPVHVTFEDAREAKGLRKPSDRDGVLRIVSIEGIDRSACGGTHVAMTSGIGPILLRRQEKIRHGLRIEFVCGERALRRVRRDLEILGRVARAFSGSIDDAAKLVEGQSAQLAELQSENKRLAESLAEYRAVELQGAASPRADGLRVVVERVTSGVDSARSLALAFAPLAKVMFVAVSSNPPSILVATSADSGVDAGKLLRPLLEKVGGRGGGSARLAQGSVPRADLLESVLASLVSGT